MEENQPISTRNLQIFAEVIKFLRIDNWPFIQISEQPILRTNFQGENGQWACFARVINEQQQFIFYSVCPVNAPENKRLAIAEFLTRANYNIVIGNFELDFNDGEIRYKTSIDVKGDRITSALIKQLIYANVLIMDEYLPGIMAVIYGDVSPKDAMGKRPA